MDPEIPRIIDFWFGASPDFQRWFKPNETLDKEIQTKFGLLVSKARASKLDDWTEQPEGTLALLVLLDQFTRNIYRGSPDSWSSDPKALDIASRAILKGFDRQVSPIQQPFFYLPLLHSENVVSQVAAMSLYEGLLARCKDGTVEKNFCEQSIQSVKAHAVPVLKFGRYPSRNKVLGRESTPDELAFLKEHPNGF